MSSSQPGYHYLTTFMMATVIFDLTNEFCQKFLGAREYFRLKEQVFHAARSGRQNIAEGYMEKSLKGYIKLLGVAKASLEELMLDFSDFLRQRKLIIYNKNAPEIREFREFRVVWVDKNHLNIPNLPNNPTLAANMLITFINLTTFLLGNQIKALEKKFIHEGGYSENLFKKRASFRSQNNYKNC